MKKHSGKKKWVLLTVIIWVLFLAAVSFGCYILQRANIYEKAKTELTDQAEIISTQFPDLVDTNFYARAVLQDRQISEIKTISFVLEKYDDIDQARVFLENIVNTTEIKKLWVFDRNGNVLFKSAPVPEDTLDADEISSILDLKAYELIEGTYDEDDRYGTVTYLLEDDKNGFLWGVKDQWLVYAEDSFSEKLKKVVQFFDWDHILQGISIGRGGSVLAVSETDGTVLSFSDSSFKGKPAEALNIRIAGDKEAVTVEQLLKEFPNTDEVKEIEVDSVHYCAARMNIDNDLFLLMLPVEAVEKEAGIETVILMVPLTLITGIGILFLFFLAGNDPKRSKNGSNKKGDQTLSTGKLKVFAILAVFLMLAITLYLETHLMYDRMFRYTSTTAEDVMHIMTDSEKMLQEMQTWLEQGNLEKCRIARCGIQHAAGEIDRQYVTDLAACLNVSSLYVFDKQGKVSLTNAPYAGYTIDENSPLHALLEGKESVVLHQEQEKTSGQVKQDSEEASDQTRQDPEEEFVEVDQAAGVTMIDDSNWVEGAVVIADSTFSMIPSNLTFEMIFQRVFLKDNSIAMVVNSDDLMVRFFARVDGSLFVSDRFYYDDTEITAADLGINESLVRDNFNGELFAVENRYFASIRRNDNMFLMVLFPLAFIDTGNLLSVFLITGSALVFFILLIFAAGKINTISIETSEAAEDQIEENIETKCSAPDCNSGKSEDDVITLLGKLANSEKYEFEERWPSDGKKWRDKTPMEKFSTSVKLICMIAVVLIAAHVIVAGENSVLYYCFNSDWGSGVNLYSITSCIIIIILLVLLGEIIHKALYLIARAAQSKGETICHLLNSFTGYILFIAGVFMILGTLGVNVAAISLTAGVAGVIFGIGCQNIVADMLAGIIMAFEGVACVGDFVSYNGKYGVIQSIGVRTTKLKRFSEITVVRNNEFKNFINMPAEETDRVSVTLCIDLKESLIRAESVIEQELPRIQDTICERTGDSVRLKYRGVQSINDSGIELSFAAYCQGMYFGWVKRMLNRELLLMCEGNGIRLAMPQIVINERVEEPEESSV